MFKKQIVGLFIAFFVGSFSLVVAQKPAEGITFWGGTWDEAKTEAQKNNKLIFVDIYATWCKPCKQMENIVFRDSSVSHTFNNSFLNFKIDGEKGEGLALSQKYGVTAYPNYLFVDANGELVHQIVGAVPPQKFMAEANLALDAFAKFRSITHLDKLYQEGDRSATFLYEYLKRKPITDTSRAFVLDEYLGVIPVATYKTEKTLSLIANNIASVESKAFAILASSLDRFQTMTPKQQNALVNGISIAKRATFKRAIKEKNKVLFEKLIGAIYETTYSPESAKQEEIGFRLEFAKLTNDFDSFKNIAQNETPLLLAKTKNMMEDETNFAIANFKEGALARGIDSQSDDYKAMLANLQNGSQRATAYKLNDFAWGYYLMTSDINELKSATEWSKRALEIDKSPTNFDTYAHLLYKAGETKEAIKNEKLAIKSAKKLGIKTTVLEEILKQMKKGSLDAVR